MLILLTNPLQLVIMRLNGLAAPRIVSLAPSSGPVTVHPLSPLSLGSSVARSSGSLKPQLLLNSLDTVFPLQIDLGFVYGFIYTLINSNSKRNCNMALTAVACNRVIITTRNSLYVGRFAYFWKFSFYF